VCQPANVFVRPPSRYPPGMAMTTPSMHTHIDAATVARTLADRAESIAPALLGEPTSKSRHELRWGRRGSVSLRLTGTKRGLWCDYASGEGGDLLDPVARQHDVPLGDAIKIARRDYLGEAIAPTPNRPERSPLAGADDAEARTRSGDTIHHARNFSVCVEPGRARAPAQSFVS
jgi:putative DNA primase/helicase